MTARSEGFSDRDRVWRNGPLADLGYTRGRGSIGIGQMLREAREGYGITFETAERETHIPRHHLQALEEERFDAFHAPVYVRGFLRSYSQYLKLDSGELLALLPPDRPLEDERLPPLSRLGRPRGPREAARERRDPAARDAPPLRRVGSDPYAVDVDPPRESRSRFEGDGGALRVVPRLDPLGRLGWPEQPNAPSNPDELMQNAPLMHEAPRAERSNHAERSQYSRTSWEQPLHSRRPRHWDVSSRWSGLVPSDTRPIFGRTPLLTSLGVAVALAILLALVLALGGADASPLIVANAGTGAATVTAPQAVAQPAVHGAMPNVQGTDLNTAVATLGRSGVVPIVIADTAGDPGSLPVTAQVPAAGASLHPESPVLLVVSAGN